MDGMKLEVFGNVGREPEGKYTPAGKFVVEASVAVETGYGDNKGTTWVKATFWEKNAELFKQLAKKGTFVYLSGTPKLSFWNKKDGGEATGQIELTVREFRILKNGAQAREVGEDEPDFMKD